MTPTEPEGDIDFFISYRGNRIEWAEWIVWVVQSEGFTTKWMKEFKVGRDWQDEIREAAEHCCRLLLLLHADYWESG